MKANAICLIEADQDDDQFEPTWTTAASIRTTGIPIVTRAAATSLFRRPRRWILQSNFDVESERKPGRLWCNPVQLPVNKLRRGRPNARATAIGRL